MEGFSLAAIQAFTGDFWPYLVVIVFGFLPTEIWRVLGVFAGSGLNENSEVFHWVRMVAAALVTAVVAKLLMSANGALATIPLWGRLLSVGLGLAAMVLARRSIVLGLITGELAIITVGFMK
jgi:Branched-chain amino acid transport protein (AzlD)